MTPEENMLLTRTGPDTPMGALLRRYWLPALLAEELPASDGPPVRVPLLGERLVAFRDTAGAVGLLAEGCPHRLASLALGRNEDGGLRCIYHGWKFDRHGRCLDLPTERPGSTLPERIRAAAYPTREAGGIVWAYLGPAALAPPFPAFPWIGLPAAQGRVWKLLHECNFLQALERDVDFAHVRISHRRLTAEAVARGTRLTPIDRQDSAPDVEVEATRYGFRYATIYRPGEAEQHLRVAAFVLPCFLVLGPIDGHHVAMAFVPRDDTTNWHFLVRYDAAQAIDAETYAATRGIGAVEPGGRKAHHRDNAYGQDRAAMRQHSFNGIEGVIVEDHALAEIQGPLVDRTREHLGSTDATVIALRATLREAALGLARDSSATPPGLAAAAWYQRIEGVTARKSPAMPWRDLAPLPAELALPGSAPP